MDMDGLTLLGLFAVTLMLLTHALEDRSPWFVLAFAAGCALGSHHGLLQGAWPFGLVEAVWTIIALRRWRQRISSREIIPLVAMESPPERDSLGGTRRRPL